MFVGSPLHQERLQRLQAAGLYVVTSQSLSSGRTTREIVQAVLRAGVSLIQLREKHIPMRELIWLAHDIRELTRSAGALLIINDRVDVALAVGADGVHLGTDDLPVDEARKLGPDLLIGGSSHSRREAEDAVERGASYVNIGPLFSTRTKHHRGDYLGVAGLCDIVPHVPIPFTVMGGIKKEHIPELVRVGARTLAVVTAITQARDPEATARDLLEEIRRCRDAASASPP